MRHIAGLIGGRAALNAAVVTDTTAPTLSAATDTTTGDTTATISVTTNEGNGTIYYVITTSTTPPSASQVKAGQNHAGAAASKSGSTAATTTGAYPFGITGLSTGTQYYTYFMHEDAATNQSTVAAADGFLTTAPDVTAPNLSVATDTTVSQTEADISVVTDEANGTLYYVVTTSSTTPSKAQVKAGQDHAGAAATKNGSVAIIATGQSTWNLTGLTTDTQYYTYFMHEDAAGNQSTVAAAGGFRTGMADTYIVTGGDQDATTSSPGGTTHDFGTGLSVGSADSRRRITVILASQGGTASTHTSCTLYPTTADRTAGTNGIALTLRAATGVNPDTASTNFSSIWDGAIPTGTTYYVRVVTEFNVLRVHMESYTHSRAFSGNPVIEEGTGTSGTTLSSTINVPSRGAMFAACTTTNASAVTVTWSGITEAWDVLATGTQYSSGGLFANTGAAINNRTISPTWSISTDNLRLIAAAYNAAL